MLFVITSPIHVPWNLFLPLYVLPIHLNGLFFACLLSSSAFISTCTRYMAVNNPRFLVLFKLKQYLLGSTLIALFLAIGHLLSLFIPLPAPVIGLLICALSCTLLGQVPTSLLLVSQLLLSNMALFFVPLIVSATLYLDYIKENWLVIMLSLLLSTLLAMTVTAKLADHNLRTLEDE